MALSQQQRTLRVMTPLHIDWDDGILVAVDFRADERISRLFRYELDMVSESSEIDFTELVGRPITVRVDSDHGERFFNGIVRTIRQGTTVVGRPGSGERDRASYMVEIVPWLWFLSRSRDCRIFQSELAGEDLTAAKLLETVVSEMGLEGAEIDVSRLEDDYQAREFCVQYRETNLEFVQRLLEEEGIAYWFEHDDGVHTMVLGDRAAANWPVTGPEAVPYNPEATGAGTEESVLSLHPEQSVVSTAATLRDFNYFTPLGATPGASPPDEDSGDQALELYDYPGEYPDLPIDGADGTYPERYAKVRLQEAVAAQFRYTGTSVFRHMLPGHRFRLDRHSREDVAEETFLITRVAHTVGQSLPEAGGGGGDVQYTNDFEAVRWTETKPYRPPRLTRRAMVTGSQTATVVGPSSEEIHTDELGRVKVKFHWDRREPNDDTICCWVRVSQLLAGQSFGSFFVPRIGQEVVVEFLEGDPDRPLITGRVYNAEQRPDWLSLPDDKTHSGIRTRSTPEGTPGNFNEISFQDKKGSEDFFMHAEKTMTVKVKDAYSGTAGSSMTSTAGGNITEKSGADIERTADDNIVDKAGKNLTVNTGKDMLFTSSGSYALKTNQGIHLKAINFVAELIESGAKDAAAAVKKGIGGGAAQAGAAGAQGAATGGAAGGASAAASTGAKAAEATGMQAMAALAPGIEAGTAEINRLSDQAAARGEALSQPVQNAIESGDQLGKAIESGAPPEVIAAAAMALADNIATSFKDAQRIIEGLLPQIPSIVMWAMKDIQAQATWGLSLVAALKNIDIEAKKNDINVKAKEHIKVEASKKDIDVKAADRDIKVTAKKKVSIKAEEGELVVEGGKEKVTIKSAKAIVLKCGSSSLTMNDKGTVVIKGKKITVKGTGPTAVKGKPVKLN